MLKLSRTYHFDLGKSWVIVICEVDDSKWIKSLTTGEFYPCDETFDEYQEGDKFKYFDVQIVPVSPVGFARLKYLAA